MLLETDKTRQGKRCDCCGMESDGLYAYECKHQTCVECLHNNLITTSFKGIGIEDIIITCQLCHNGKMCMKMELVIEILDSLLRKNSGNDEKDMNKHNNVYIYDDKRICIKHSIEAKSFCKTCELWLCSECLKQYHTAYYPNHNIINDEYYGQNGSDKPIKAEKCPEHNDTILSLFCLKCQYEICSKCLLKKQTHFLHRHITLEDKRRHDHLNYTKYQSYEAFANFIEQSEANFFGKIENDYIIQKTRIDEFVKNLNDLFSDYTNQMEIFQQRMKKIYQVIKLSYYNYYEAMTKQRGDWNSSQGGKRTMFGLSKTLTDIAMLSQKIVDIDGLNTVLINQNISRNQEKLFDYEIIWNNNEITPLQKQENCHSDGVTKIVELKHSKGFATASTDSVIKIWEYAKEELKESKQSKQSKQSNQSKDKQKASSFDNKVTSINRIDDNYDEREYPFEDTVKSVSEHGSNPYQSQISNFTNNNKIVGQSVNISNSTNTKRQVRQMNNTQTLKGHKGGIWALIEIGDGCLISGSSDKAIKLWLPHDGIELHTFKGHKQTVYSLVELPNNQFASGSEDKTIKIWDYLKKTCLYTLNGHKGKVTVLNVLLDGFLISGSEDNSLMIWNVPEQKSVGKLIGHGCTVWCSICFDDGISVASGSSDNSIRLWNLNDLRSFMTLEGHDNTISNLVMMKNGYLASCSWDGSVKFWDLNKRMCVYTVKEHNGIVWDIIEVSDGTMMTVSNDKSVIVWEKK